MSTGNAFGNRSGIDIDVNLPRMGRKGLHLPGDPVVETGAHGQENVAVGDGHVGLKGAVHAQHAEEKGMVAREPSEAHQGVGDGDGHLLGQGEKFLVGVGE